MPKKGSAAPKGTDEPRFSGQRRGFHCAALPKGLPKQPFFFCERNAELYGQVEHLDGVAAHDGGALFLS
ncbi:MAG: hypothetical protein LUF77_04445, partial [Oscillospiraceae bacterium]|nr:hypothetical protein [Oscillospiraceae bacterium]